MRARKFAITKHGVQRVQPHVQVCRHDICILSSVKTRVFHWLAKIPKLRNKYLACSIAKISLPCRRLFHVLALPIDFPPTFISSSLIGAPHESPRFILQWLPWSNSSMDQAYRLPQASNQISLTLHHNQRQTWLVTSYA